MIVQQSTPHRHNGSLQTPGGAHEAENLAAGLSVVVPVYNSESTLVPLVHRLEKVLRELSGLFELILVNDSSADSSWSVIEHLAGEYAWVRGINLMRNYGQHNALLCGIRAARFSVIATMDDDLQHPPEELPRLLQQLTNHCDVVYGTPRKEQHGILRDAASQITKWALQSAMGAETARNVSAYRVLRTPLRDAFVQYQSSFVSIDVLLTWSTTRFRAIPVQHDARAAGVSNYTFRKLAVHALNMMTGFSVLPLQLASVTGFAFTVFGLGVLLYVIGYYLWAGRTVPGFAFLASIISIFSGAQMFALGIIGEYLARMHFRMMERPTYAVRQRTEL
jgi:undecaprenyl-phosphate 4-deoxy-4-formamido-L-arabinose transferase